MIGIRDFRDWVKNPVNDFSIVNYGLPAIELLTVRIDLSPRISLSYNIISTWVAIMARGKRAFVSIPRLRIDFILFQPFSY